MGNYRLHYTSADGPGDDATWSVYREEYVAAEAAEPIDGLTVWLGSYPTEQAADTAANALQRQVLARYAPARCTCPTFDPRDFDGPEDHAAACSDCPQHGTH